MQTRRGSRASYARREEAGGFRTEITADLAAWLAGRESFYLATANAQGRPYMQHRGGEPGFIHVLDTHTLAFADYRGNRQYITVGNLAENDQAMMFLMDYTTQSRIKIWGRARVVEDAPALMAQLMPAGSKVVPEQVIVFSVEAWDSNCPKHIPQMVKMADVAPIIADLRQRVSELETLLTQRPGG